MWPIPTTSGICYDDDDDTASIMKREVLNITVGCNCKKNSQPWNLARLQTKKFLLTQRSLNHHLNSHK